MVDDCRHPLREEIIDLGARTGWSYSSETAKTIRFVRGGFAMNFNGEEHGSVDLLFDPVLAGANFLLFAESVAVPHERFGSNFQNFPRKVSKNGVLKHFGVGLKFPDIESAEQLLKNMQIPELVA